MFLRVQLKVEHSRHAGYLGHLRLEVGDPGILLCAQYCRFSSLRLEALAQQQRRSFGRAGFLRRLDHLQVRWKNNRGFFLV